jgi:predicted nucleic acid-binding protein
MKFWDTSALLPLFITESSTETLRALFDQDPDIMVWAFTPVELVSAVWRRVDGRTDTTREAIVDTVMQAQTVWSKVVTYAETARLALTMCERHRLRAADALQLAAALDATLNPSSRPFVTLDHDLASAARAEGFPVLP